jgi:hypothetical protein
VKERFIRSIFFIISFVRAMPLLIALAGCASGPAIGPPRSPFPFVAQPAPLVAEKLTAFFGVRGIPMPNDLRVVAPAGIIPAHLAKYSGAYIGEFAGDRGITTGVIFERIDANGTADVVYARSAGPYSRASVRRLKLVFTDRRSAIGCCNFGSTTIRRSSERSTTQAYPP